MRRFFYDTSNDISDERGSLHPQLSTLAIGDSAELTESIVHHWCRVLRANIGDQGIFIRWLWRRVSGAATGHQ